MILPLALYLSVSAHASEGPIGFLTLWPRRNIVVYSNALIEVDGVAIHSIEAYSDSQIIVSDVAGERWMWDLKELRVASQIRREAIHPKFTFIESSYRPLHLSQDFPSSLPSGWKKGYDHADSKGSSIGIGIGKFSTSWFTVDYGFNSSGTSINITKISTIQEGKKSAFLKFLGEVSPVAVWDKNTYLATYPSNGRFGHLMYVSKGKRTVLLDNASVFLPLRLNR